MHIEWHSFGNVNLNNMEALMDQMNNISKLLAKFRDIFANNYQVEHCEKRDHSFTDLEIPTPLDDKENMKRDRKAIVTDINKAIESKKLELVD